MRIKGSDLKKIIREEISRSMQTSNRVLSEATVPQDLVDSAYRKINSVLGEFPFALEPALKNLAILSDTESSLASDFARFLNGPFGRTNPYNVAERVLIGLITGKIDAGGTLLTTIGTMGYKMYGLDFDGTSVGTAINSSSAKAASIALVEKIREIVNFAGEGGNEVNHMVKSGDTLSHLAQRYGTTVDAIMDRNNLRSDMIMAGQNLVIPQ